MTIHKAKIGKNGEIIISKEIQEELQLKEGDELVVKVEKGKLTIEKHLSVIDLLDRPPLAVMSPEEIEKDLEDLRLEAEQQVEKNL